MLKTHFVNTYSVIDKFPFRVQQAAITTTHTIFFTKHTVVCNQNELGKPKEQSLNRMKKKTMEADKKREEKTYQLHG